MFRLFFRHQRRHDSGGLDRSWCTGTLAESFGPLPAMRVEKIGYGAGRADLTEVPNVLRVLTGTLPPRQDDVVSVVETNIDDMNPEIFGYLMEKLFDDGALDVFWVPVIMKKNRPGTMVKVICRGRVRDAVIARLLTETTTAGVRYSEMQRRLLEREQVKIATRYGEIAVKRIETPDGTVRLVPEYDTCRKIALEKNIPLQLVYETIVKEAGAR
ncbi:MAG: LarC family nickel insertion protein [Desulfobacterales bacterium]